MFSLSDASLIEARRNVPVGDDRVERKIGITPTVAENGDTCHGMAGDVEVLIHNDVKEARPRH